jgi:hypothetical protein
MKTYLVRCGYEAECQAHLVVRAGDPSEAGSKAKQTPLFQSLAMHVDQVIDSSLLCKYLQDIAEQHHGPNTEVA